MAISKAMRAALHALSYTANIDLEKTYRVERAVRSLRTPLAPLYHLWDHKIERDGHDIRVRIYTPKKQTDGRLLLFFHGGGWVLGDYPTHRRLVHDLVAESGCAAVFVNYTPSPEARFPQAVEEIYIAVKWVAENGREIGVDGSRLALAGNSVGGNMSLAAALLAKDHGGPQIRTLVLMWPVTDAGYDWDSYVEYGRQRFLTAPLMKWMFEQYVSDPAQRGSDLMSPVRASAERLRGLPPTLIAVAENDILRDEGEKMGRRLDEAGVEVTTVRFNGVIHDWGMLNGFAGLHPTRTLVRLAGAVLRDYLRE